MSASPPKPWERNPTGTPSEVVTGGAAGNATAAAAAASGGTTTGAATSTTTGTSGLGTTGSTMGSRYGMSSYGMSGMGMGMSSYGMGGYGMSGMSGYGGMGGYGMGGMGMMGMGGMGMMGMQGMDQEAMMAQQRMQMMIMMMQQGAQQVSQFGNMINMSLQTVMGTVSQFSQLHDAYKKSNDPQAPPQPQVTMGKDGKPIEGPQVLGIEGQKPQMAGPAVLPSAGGGDAAAATKPKPAGRSWLSWLKKVLLLFVLYRISKVMTIRLEQLYNAYLRRTLQRAAASPAAWDPTLMSSVVK